MMTFITSPRRALLAVALLLPALAFAQKDGATAQQKAPVPLAKELTALQEQYKKNLPPEMSQVMEKGIQQVSASPVMKAAKKTGDKAPDFMLPSSAGPYVQLNERLAQGPVVIVWYRGGWCPYCNLQLAAWERHIKDLQDAGGQLIAISPELPDSAMSTAERHKADYTVLSDTGAVVARSYGIVYALPEEVAKIYAQALNLEAYNGNKRMEMPLSATYVIDKEGVIRYSFLEADYRKRAEPSEVIEVVKKLAKK